MRPANLSLWCACFAAPIVWSAGVVEASVIVGFNLGSVGNSSVPSVSATTVDPSVSAAPLTRGSGLTTPTSITRAFSSAGWSTTATSFAAAAAANDFYQTALTVQAGETLSLTAINSDMRRSSSAAPNQLEWAYSFDGFNADSEVAGTYTDLLTSVTNTNGEAEPPIDLTGLANLQDIQPGATVTFRLYAFGATSTGATLAVGRLASTTPPQAANDLEFDGSASSVPEPTSIGLLALAVCGTIRARAPRSARAR